MSALRCVHLLDDFSLGGVSKSMCVFDDPALASTATSTIMPIDPGWRLAPRIEADVVVTHFPPSWRTLPFLRSIKLRNPGVHWVHDEHSYTGAWEALKVPNRRRFRRAVRWGLGGADRVVAVSKGQAAWLGEVLERRRIDVLHPWSGDQGLLDVPMPRFEAGPIRLGAYGRFAEAKGFDMLIDAVARLDPALFTLRLGGLGPNEAALNRRAADLPNVEMVGRIDDVAGFLGTVDVVVVPSRWEAFGQVAAEARAAGRPVVVAAVDGLPEQVGSAGLVADCATADGLAATIAQLPVHDLAAMSIAARRSMSDAAETRVAAWRSLFQDIAAERRSLAVRAATPIRIRAGQNRYPSTSRFSPKL